jgi:hypothetical protein
MKVHVDDKVSPDQGWPNRGPNSNRESAIFRYFGSITSGFCYHVTQKVYFLGKKFSYGPETKGTSTWVPPEGRTPKGRTPQKAETKGRTGTKGGQPKGRTT